MELNFNKTENGYVTEFEVTSDFNLHIERKESSALTIYQRGSASGEYASAFTKGMYEGARVVDYDFGALVYPKWIKVVSGSEVIVGEVTFA